MIKSLKENFNKRIKLIESSVKYLGENYKSLVLLLLGMQLLLILAFHTVHKSSMGLSLLVGIPQIILYVFVKDVFSEKEYKLNFGFLKTSILLFLFNIINHLIYSFVYIQLQKQSGLMMKINPLTAMNFAILFNLIIGLGYFMVLKSDKTKEILEVFEEESIWNFLGIELFGGENSVGDVQLCKDAKTDRPVFIPHKDRYLHMLVLGPTGSGKTSQIIIPMLNQDMQNPDAGITVLEPKGDLAEKIYAMAQVYGRKAIYFNPTLDACPTFNPLYGKEEDVIENMATTFRMLNPESPQYFQDINEELLRNSLKVLKRLKGNTATLIDLATIMTNPAGQGRTIVKKLEELNPPAEIKKENEDILNYFTGDYYVENSKVYENCSGIRSQVSKIISNKFLRRVLNPPNGKSDIDFDSHLSEGGIICITTAQGSLRDLGKYLGYFLILTFQASVFKRPGNEDTRKPHFLYIDEFQVYSNPGFADMLTQGRSYRVASHLATQNRSLIGMGSGRDGDDFTELVSTNARNIVIFPGANYSDADYYSKQFGEIVEKSTEKGVSQAKFNPLYGIQQVSYPNETTRFKEELVARYTPSDIIYKDFGEITYAIIKNNTLQHPNTGTIEYIPYELNQRLDKMILENHSLMTLGYDPNQCRNEDATILDSINIEEIIEKVEDMNLKGITLDELLIVESSNAEDNSEKEDEPEEKEHYNNEKIMFEKVEGIQDWNEGEIVSPRVIKNDEQGESTIKIDIDPYEDDTM